MVNQQSDNINRGVNGTFDLEAAIAGLLGDAGSRSLELPCFLTPEQRNKAKLVAGQYPELKCESYGFGSDRRLHVFKKSATTCVRVKNTFVDGLASSDEDKQSDAIIIRSEPCNLRACLRLYSAGRPGNGKLELPPLCRHTSPTVTPVGSEASEGSEGGSDRDSGDKSPSTVDEIGPIMSCVTQEATSRSDPSDSNPEPPAFPPGTFDTFPVGTMVVIKGLKRAPAFNGRIGVAHSLDSETGRYDVLLASPSSGQQSHNQWAKVKYENLRRISSASACNTSSAAA